MDTKAESTLFYSEIKFIADFLACAASDFSEQSCNDFSVPCSHVNLKALTPIIAYQIQEFGEKWEGDRNPEAYLENGKSDKGHYVISNEWAAEFYSSKYKNAPPDSISSAEAFIVAGLLESIAELHEEWAEQDSDIETASFTLPPTDENKTFVAAVLEYQGKRAKSKKNLESTLPISMPDYWVMKYLAHRCKTLGTCTDIIHIVSPGHTAQALTEQGIPVIHCLGVAPRFPDVKKYLKKYSVNFPNWQDNDLNFLKRYADQGPGFDHTNFNYAGSENYVYKNYDALRNLENCSMMLRWHAIQVALGASIPKRQTSKGIEACIKKFEALQGHARHIWSYLDDLETRDFKVARHLMYVEAFTPAELEQAILVSTRTTAIAPEQRAKYAANIARRAADDPATQCFIRMRQQAQLGLEEYRKQIGADWTIPWRRALAYHYWACNMGKHLPQGILRRLHDLVPTMVHCLLLGWEDWAWELYQLCHDRVIEGFFALNKKKPEVERRTQLFVLQLIDQSQNKRREKYPSQAYDEPIFEALLKHWCHPDPDAIAPLLLAACDRHTHLSMAKGDSPELEREEHWYDPFEILLVLHLRRQLGLANPELDHLIMNTPLGKLPEPAPKFQDALLEAVVSRYRTEFPKM